MYNRKGKIMVRYSILIPVYNKLECLKKYFKYIENQTFENYEIIVVDDGSNDGSFEYLSERLKHNDKMKLSRNPINRGIGSVRNALLSMASGEYILFVDPDDYIETLLLEELDKYYNLDLDIIRYQNVIEPVGEKQISLENGKNLYRYSCEATNVISGEEALLLWSFGERNINTFPWTYAIKRKIFDGVKYPEISLLEDFAITPYLIAKSNKIKAIDYIGYHYLKYDESLSTNSADFALEKLKIFKQVVELAKYYISMTQISLQTKELYYNDLENRYNVREKKVYSKSKK